MGLSDMVTHIDEANTNVNTETDLIAQITTALEGKAGGGLNFEVVGGTTQPNSPRENTIWINTDTPILGWGIGKYVNTPGWYMPDGYVYIDADTDSNTGGDFNALKKNEIWLEPHSAIQKVNDVWVKKTLKLYKNGAFVDCWNGYVVRDGIAIKDLAVLNAAWSSSSGHTGNDATVTQKDGYVSVKGAQAGYCAAYVQMNITPATRLVIEGSFHATNNVTLAVWSRIGPCVSDNMVASALLTSTGASLDVSSLTGPMYVGITSIYTHEQGIVNLYLE